MKTAIRFFGAILLAGVISMQVSAQNVKQTGTKEKSQTTAQCKFVDNNKDGVCDNVKAKGCGQGTNFVDKDKNGVCDNKEAKAGTTNCCGKGKMNQNGQGNGNCKAKCNGCGSGKSK